MTKASLTKIRDEANKKYGDNSVMFAADTPRRPPISSGSLALDFATGIAGLPSDRVIEVSGTEGSGKTTMALLAMASFLDAQPDRAALILDTEAKITMEWVSQLIGTERMSRVLLAWPEHIEAATNIYIDLVGTGQICFVIFDSIGGSPTKAVTEKDAEKGEIGGSAKAITRFARLASTYSQKHHVLTLGINQVRADMDGFRRHIVPGGHGWLHACSLRIKLHRSTRDVVTAKINGEDVNVGFKVIAKIIKNQLGGAEGRSCEWWMYTTPTEQYGAIGIDTLDEIIRLSTVTNVIEQRGGWYSHPALPPDQKGETKVNGRDRLTEVIRDDEALRQTIVSEVMAVLSAPDADLSQVAPIVDSDDSDVPIEGEGEY